MSQSAISARGFGSGGPVTSYPEDHPQGQFDRHFGGVWEPKWWRKLIGVAVPDAVKITSYRTGEVTGQLHRVCGVDEDGERYVLAVEGLTIPGWRRVDA